MVSNELLFVLATLVGVIAVFIAAQLGREWLLGTIAVNLLLIGIFGAKLISIFGFVTNAGNVFYACVFLATHFLIERHGMKLGWQTIWFGTGFVLFFTLMSQIAVNYNGSPLSDTINSANATFFSFSPRIVIASVLAYFFAQYVNVTVFLWVREKTKGRFLWLRSNGANILSQLVDSLLFFSIAFVDLSGPLLVQAILIGWFLKSLVVLVGTPFLYVDAHLGRKKL